MQWSLLIVCGRFLCVLFANMYVRIRLNDGLTPVLVVKLLGCSKRSRGAAPRESCWKQARGSFVGDAGDVFSCASPVFLCSIARVNPGFPA